MPTFDRTMRLWNAINDDKPAALSDLTCSLQWRRLKAPEGVRHQKIET